MLQSFLIAAPQDPNGSSKDHDDGNDGNNDDNDGENAADEGEQPPESADAPPPENQAAGSSTDTKRWTKGMLYAAYKGRGPHRMTFDFLHQPSVREHLVIISELGRALQTQYTRDLDAQKSPRLERFKWVADRATNGSALSAAIRILNVLFSPRFHTKLRLTPPIAARVLDTWDERIQDDMQILGLALEFAINLAGNFVWSEQMYSWTLPLACGGLLSQSCLTKKSIIMIPDMTT